MAGWQAGKRILSTSQQYTVDYWHKTQVRVFQMRSHATCCPLRKCWPHRGCPLAVHPMRKNGAKAMGDERWTMGDGDGVLCCGVAVWPRHACMGLKDLTRVGVELRCEIYLPPLFPQPLTSIIGSGARYFYHEHEVPNYLGCQAGDDRLIRYRSCR